MQDKTNKTECKIPSIFKRNKQSKEMIGAIINRMPIPVQKVTCSLFLMDEVFTFIICIPKIAKTIGEYAAEIIETPVSMGSGK